MEFQKSGDGAIFGIPEIRNYFRFMEFQLQGVLFPFSYLLNSKNSHYFQNFRFVYFQEFFLFLKLADFWNSNSWDYLVSIPIFEIPKIWELHVYQYLAVRVKCEIVPQYLDIPNFCHSVCFSSPTLQCIDPPIFQLQSLFFRNWQKTWTKTKINQYHSPG